MVSQNSLGNQDGAVVGLSCFYPSGRASSLLSVKCAEIQQRTLLLYLVDVRAFVLLHPSR